ncbi:amidohydrolase [Propionicicella superfundia]|uniref:amidohydrolase n=1 Tax=Propionicicella superfundia TaxID=348582 RepID=UPI000415D07C|nr:amidohydrolase [Propionicicella superfundia]
MSDHRWADTVFVNGTVHQQHGRAAASAVAVDRGRIVAIGADAVAQHRGPRTEVVDLAGRALLPGFIDSHLHLVGGGIARLQCDLSGVHSLEGYRQLIADYAAGHPGPWIEGFGWYGDLFPGGFPHRRELDRLIPDRPAAFQSHDAHSLWVNSAALRIAGIDKDTPDPPGGRIARDSDGEPTGHVLELAADLIDAHRPAPDRGTVDRALLEAQAYLHGLGITAWQDALVGEALGMPDPYDHYRRAAADGSLASRVTGALYWHPGSGLDLARELAARRDAADGRFRATAAKFILDGNCENLTGAVFDAYAGHPGEHGVLQFGDDELAAAARALDDLGFDLHLHAVGDRAVAQALDAIEATANRGRRRHQIAHIDLIARPDLERMRRLGTIANVTPLWARHDPVLVETKLPLLTADQQERHFAYGSLARAGVRVAFGSDWPVSTPDPIANIHTAVNRTAAPGDPHASDPRSLADPLLPGEALPVEAAVRAYTSEAAHACGLSEFAGSIEVGKEADLVVLDRDPLQVESAALGTLRVEATFVHGRLVHER